MSPQERHSRPPNELVDAVHQLRKLGKIWFENKDPVWGLPSGLPSLDYITGGLHDGELTVIGARTSHGKSALASQLTFQTIEDIIDRDAMDEAVVVVSPEMTGIQLLLRQASQMTHLNSRQIRSGAVTVGDYETWDSTVDAMQYLEPVFKLHTQGAEMEEIYNWVKSYGRESTVRLVVIDYLQRLPLSIKHGENRTSALANASNIAKDLARDLDVPVVLLSQLRRPPLDKEGKEDESVKPMIFDLLGSGGIEQAADNVLLLWTDVVKMRRNPGQTVPAQIEIAKNRNGEMGYVNMRFNPPITKFEERGTNRRTDVQF